MSLKLGWASYSLTPETSSQWRSQRPDQKRIGSDSWSTFEYEGIETGKQMYDYGYVYVSAYVYEHEYE